MTLLEAARAFLEAVDGQWLYEDHVGIFRIGEVNAEEVREPFEDLKRAVEESTHD